MLPLDFDACSMAALFFEVELLAMSYTVETSGTCFEILISIYITFSSL